MSESFDRALRSAARRGRPAGVCPDAASLAAYADNGLTADERRRVEAHAADCATCLEHLALLGAISLDREAPEPSRSWLVRWGWLVPVATAVLLVAVWVRLPEQKASEDARPPSARTRLWPPALPEQERAAEPPLRRSATRRDAIDAASCGQDRAGPTCACRPPAETKVDELAALERQDSARQRVATATRHRRRRRHRLPLPRRPEDAVREKAQASARRRDQQGRPACRRGRTGPGRRHEEGGAHRTGVAPRVVSRAGQPHRAVQGRRHDLEHRAVGSAIDLHVRGLRAGRWVLDRHGGWADAAPDTWRVLAFRCSPSARASSPSRRAAPRPPSSPSKAASSSAHRTAAPRGHPIR